MPPITPELMWEYLPWLYLALISLVAVVVTVYDKLAAKAFPNHRTRERTLFLISGLGGAVAMFLTMQLIRHKTKHMSFMIGIPLIILAQVLLAVAVWYLL